MNQLFTISQVSKSCAISRATILRLEEKGLIHPAKIDKQNKYRYYDIHNITAILQMKHFLHIGMNYDDILLYYQARGRSPQLLKQLEDRMYSIIRTYEEMKLRMSKEEQLHFEMISLPQYVCYAKQFSGLDTEDRYQKMYQLYLEVIEKGYRPLCDESLFIIEKRMDFIEDTYKEEVVDFICCIPLEPQDAPQDALILPACKAFSCLYYGNYNRLPDVYNEFGKKIRELGIVPTDYPRGLGVVASYTGKDISPDDYVSRIIIPIAEERGASFLK